MDTMKNVAALAALTAGLGLTALLPATPATAHGDDGADGVSRISARGDDEVIRRGNCRGSSADWKLKVKTDDGRLEVEGEVDSNVNGQRWAWVIRHNGSVSARGQGVTVGPSGSFDVERRVVDLSGTDTLVFRAERRGAVCRGVVNY